MLLPCPTGTNVTGSEMLLRCPGGRRRRFLVYLSLLTLVIFTSYLLFIPRSANISLQLQENAGRKIQSAIVYRGEHAQHMAIPEFPHSASAPGIEGTTPVESTIKNHLLSTESVEKVVHNRFRFNPPGEQNPTSEKTTPQVKSKLLAATTIRISTTSKTTTPKLVELIQKGKEELAAPGIVNKDENEPPDLPPRPPQNTLLSREMMMKMPAYSPRRYIKEPEAYARYRDYLNKVEAPLPKQEKAVIILTNHRSGSSFFGELFNQHPDAFYLFEPLFPLSNSSECKLHSDLKIQVLKDLIECQLPNWVKIYEGIPYKEQIRKNVNMKQCMGRGMCFRQNTKEMCEDRHCPRTNSSSVINCATDCGQTNPTLVNNDCRRKNVIVLKVIRLCDILQLGKLTKSTSTDIKIIQLIRDPRGIGNSRQLINRRVNLKQSLYMTCKRQSHNMMTALLNTPEWLKGNYMAVRYEDAALFPYETAQSVYDFVGLTFPDSMKNWIAKNTDIEIPTNAISADEEISEQYQPEDGNSRMKRGVDADIKKRIEEIRRKSSQARIVHKRANPYGTKRNSTAVVQKWASRLPYSAVLQIESVCVNIMKMAGYKKVGTPEQYRIKNEVTYFTDGIEILKKSKHT